MSYRSRPLHAATACERGEMCVDDRPGHAVTLMRLRLAHLDPAGRIIMRIVVVQTSALVAQREAQIAIPSMPPMASEHIVQACMQVEQASIASCSAVMSMAMPMSFDIAMVFISSVVVSITRAS